MKASRPVSALILAALLSSCGGGGDGGGAGSAPSSTATTTPAPTPPPTGAGTCSLQDRQNWAAAQLDEWYLFPELLPVSLSAAGFGTVDDYLDALTANARAQRKDRYFTYLTSIREEEAYYESGAVAGLGVRLASDAASGRVLVSEAFEGAPALAAGIDRGTEILAIGTSASDLRPVAELLAAGGGNAVSRALGPDTAGTARVLRVADAGGTREVTVAKATYALTPVSARYGARIIEDGGRRVGYLNLRTFIETADPALRDAFASFRAAGITELIVDFRYNGGGLLSIAELMGDLLGANRSGADIFSRTSFRPSKAANDETRPFAPQPQSIAPGRIAFIGTGGTASASELVANAMIPYLGANAGLIGANTFGKPVGQIALDRAQCDDRLRVVAFATQNRDRQGEYYNGLATVMRASCRASDDLAYPLGDPREASVRAALDYLAGRPCSTIASAGRELSARSVRSLGGGRELITPDRPSSPQREVPGLF